MKRKLLFETLESRRLLATYFVSSSGDSGPGSLRQAILDANANAGFDSIHFSLPDGDLRIEPQTAFPRIDDDLIIDARTQPGFGEEPIVQISGEFVIQAWSALDFHDVDRAEVYGLQIAHFPSYAISATGSSNVTLQQNQVGWLSGQRSEDARKSESGINVRNSNNVLIGGEGAGNYISGNRADAVLVFQSNEVTLQANRIGTTEDGFGLRYNRDGIYVSASEDTWIGGPGLGNLLSGNETAIRVASSARTTIQGNIIGTNLGATSILGNTEDGIEVRESTDTIIGADGDGIEDDLEGNVIAGNARGVFAIYSNRIAVGGNWIGTDASSSQTFGNAKQGILFSFVSAGYIGRNATGFANEPTGNVIVGSEYSGIELFRSSDIEIQGNFVGLLKNGEAFPNKLSGVFTHQGEQISIGGNSRARANVISGNSEHGVHFDGTIDSVFEGNLIGTDASGSVGVPNGYSGIYLVEGSGIRIGEPESAFEVGDRHNIISGNTEYGIRLSNSRRNTITGNFLGVGTDGISAIPNEFSGVLLENGSAHNVVGVGTPLAADSRTANVISGNGRHGVELEGAADNVIGGNLVGLTSDGSSALANGSVGVSVHSDSTDNLVGIYGGQGARNVLAASELASVAASNSLRTIIAGNYVGTDATATHAIGEQSFGILLGTNATNSIVEGNVVSAPLAGISVWSAFDNHMRGNLIGINEFDQVLHGGHYGIQVSDGSANNIIGIDDSVSNDPAHRNIISGHARAGISIGRDTLGNGLGSSSSTDGNIIAGNYIGTDRLGRQAIPNGFDVPNGGIFFAFSASGTVIGTTGDSPADSLAGNLIAGNIGPAILLGYARMGQISGNQIGVNVDGEPLVNSGLGIVSNGAQQNMIGGLTAIQRNTILNAFGPAIRLNRRSVENSIAGNLIESLDPDSAAILLVDAERNNIGLAGLANQVISAGKGLVIRGDTLFASGNSLRNTVFQSDGQAVDLGDDGRTVNDPGDEDQGPNDLQNFPELQIAGSANGRTVVGGVLNSEPETDYEIEVFAYDDSGNMPRESQGILIGITNTRTGANGIANWRITSDFEIGLPNVYATATSADAGVSEWSDPYSSRGLLSLQVDKPDLVEGWTITGTVTRYTADLRAEIVQLDTDASQLQIPESLVFPQGVAAVEFELTVLRNELMEQDQIVDIYARSLDGSANGLIALTVRDAVASWHNAVMPMDVNGDARVSAIDALLIINFLNQPNEFDLTEQDPQIALHIDVNNDGSASAIDALTLIDELNRPEAEGEARPTKIPRSFDTALASMDWFAIEEELRIRH
ncbi:MAG: NosD domain-containing protein [Planctomycetota bacterium]